MYSAKVKMSRAEFDHVNELLAIEEFGQDSARDVELGVDTGEDRILYSVVFEDGMCMDLHLFSGASNYWTEPVFYNTYGEIETDNTDFSLSENETFACRGELYTVEIEFED